MARQYRRGMDEVGELYLRFAADEADGSSATYATLARAVAESEALCRFVAQLPVSQRQPNLLFGALRLLGLSPRSASDLSAVIDARGAEVHEIMRTRVTQTNEPARCATLLPALARLPQPLALIEVGASAGLCLYPDRYGYDYGRRLLTPEAAPAGSYPIFRCAASEGTPLPERLPEVVWRAGIDLRPISLADADGLAWMRALIWPEHTQRAADLDIALAVARSAPAMIHQGDLLELVGEVAAGAPADATLVIFHSAVLFYLSVEERARFVAQVRALPGAWISNEAPRVLPDAMSKLDREPASRRFLLCVDGRPVAFTAHHGQSVEWLSS